MDPDRCAGRDRRATVVARLGLNRQAGQPDPQRAAVLVDADDGIGEGAVVGVGEVFEPRTPVIAIAVGVGVTMLSAIIPAPRAVRIAPVAALREHTEDQPGSGRRRQMIAGVVIGVAGLAALLAGLTKPATLLVGAGALAVVIATGMLVPFVARPLSSAPGRPLAALLGMPGRLGRENSTRQPRRTAQTSAALMVGLSLVSTIAVLGA